MATGAGKGSLLAYVAKEWRHRGPEMGLSDKVLVLSHKRELVLDLQQRLEAICGEPCGVEMADLYADSKTRLVSACVPTMRGGRLLDWATDHFGLVIVDETHHAMAPSWRAIIEHFTGAKVIGWTATPDRADKKGLTPIYGTSVAYVYSIARAITEKTLVPIVAKTVSVGFDLSGVKTTAGDLNQGALDEEMSKFVNEVAHGVYAEAGDRSTIVYTTSVDNAHAIALVLNEIGALHGRGICAKAIDSNTPTEERDAIFKDFHSGAFQYMVNVGIATEGVDLPRCSCVAIARPTKSRSLYVQMVGRMLRLFAGKANALLLEFAGNAGKHDLATPEDILGSDDTKEVKARAKKLRQAEPKMVLGEALEVARQQLIDEAEAKRRAKLKVKVKSTSFDPFATLGVSLETGAARDVDWRFGAQAPTEWQVATMDKAKVPHAGMTRRQAAVVCDAIAARRGLGLATLPMVKVLQRAGVEGADKMEFAEAGRAIAKIKDQWTRR